MEISRKHFLELERPIDKTIRYKHNDNTKLKKNMLIFMNKTDVINLGTLGTYNYLKL